MTSYREIIDKYYNNFNNTKNILITHCNLVCDKALKIAQNHPELNIDQELIVNASMLHDIAIFMTNAPDIYCFGTYPYICHGYLGRELLEKENLKKEALVAERHTGTGITLNEILKQNLPLPHRNMVPISIEEQIICFADKFYSKSKDYHSEIPISKIRTQLIKRGEEQLKTFDKWCEIFL
jgi:uncharacterized protein